MKITENSSFVNLDIYAKNIEGNKQQDNPGKEINKNTLKNDEVILSSFAKRINETKKILNSLPDIREQKIAGIKMQIEEGEYRVDEKEIASRMLKESILNEIL